MRCVLLLGIVLQTLTVFSQDMLGKWRGTLFQDVDRQFYCEMTLTGKEGNQYVGRAFYKTVMGPHIGVVMFEITLTEQGDRLLYQDGRVLQDNKSSEDFFWCVKKGDLSLIEKNGEWILAGKWGAEGCDAGRFWIKKDLPPAPKPEKEIAPPIVLAERVVEEKARIEVGAKQITVQLWDNKREDGDIISLNLNGKWILKNYRVTNARKTLQLELDQPENLLVLHAENLGKMPPNTAAISIDDGSQRKILVLNSDMGKSEALRIVR